MLRQQKHRRLTTTLAFALLLTLLTLFLTTPPTPTAARTPLLSTINDQLRKCPPRLVRVRKEWRELTETERLAFLNAVNVLKAKPSLLGTTKSRYDDFAMIHWENVAEAQGVPAFLPWHRWFLRLFEKELQVIDQKVVVPYWDWSIDSQAPERSPLFSPNYFGGNGQGPDNCVQDGKFWNWT
ncbi:hypothetical protein HK102_005520, partial [Quaeritorhiza haematococci]